MATVVARMHRHGRNEGRTTLEQVVVFEGTDAAAISDVLLTAPLTGADSVFGARPGEPGPRTDSSRTLRGFSPAPGFHFDVHMAAHGDGVFLVWFAQPERSRPYLQGTLMWTVSDDDGKAVLEEQINTAKALQAGAEPLGGPRPSLRRWLFFRAGHKQVMKRATDNIARLLSR